MRSAAHADRAQSRCPESPSGPISLPAGCLNCAASGISIRQGGSADPAQDLVQRHRRRPARPSGVPRAAFRSDPGPVQGIARARAKWSKRARDGDGRYSSRQVRADRVAGVEKRLQRGARTRPVGRLERMFARSAASAPAASRKNASAPRKPAARADRAADCDARPDVPTLRTSSCSRRRRTGRRCCCTSRPDRRGRPRRRASQRMSVDQACRRTGTRRRSPRTTSLPSCFCAPAPNRQAELTGKQRRDLRAVLLESPSRRRCRS